MSVGRYSSQSLLAAKAELLAYTHPLQWKASTDHVSAKKPGLQGYVGYMERSGVDCCHFFHRVSAGPNYVMVPSNKYSLLPWGQVKRHKEELGM